MEINKNIELIIKGIVESMVVNSEVETRADIETGISHDKYQQKLSWYYNLKDNEKELFWEFITNDRLSTISQLLRLISNNDGDSSADLFEYELFANKENIGEGLYWNFQTILNNHFNDLYKKFVLGE